MEYLIDRPHLLIRGCMKHDDDRSDQTYCATNLAENAQVFFKEVGTQDGTGQTLAKGPPSHSTWVTNPINTDRAPRGVTRIAGANAYAAKLKISPTTTAQNQVVFPSKSHPDSLVMMPAHQMGLRKYEKPSPSKPCFSAEAFRPYGTGN